MQEIWIKNTHAQKMNYFVANAKKHDTLKDNTVRIHHQQLNEQIS